MLGGRLPQNKDSHGIWGRRQLLYQIKKKFLLMEDFPEEGGVRAL